jgi:UDP-N-acetylmuramate dehydrogenase
VTTRLSELTTLGLGGPARDVLRPSSLEDFIATLRWADQTSERVLLLGGGSNVVVSDEGFDGIVVVAGGGEVRSQADLDTGWCALTVEAGVDWDSAVECSLEHGWAGLEALSGIPGSTGATPVQNVGAYGQEVADTLASVFVMDRSDGRCFEMTAAECGFSYRHSVFKHNDRFAVLEVTFELHDNAGLSEPVRYAELARALGVEVGERAPLQAVRDAVLALRRAKSMVLDPADPNRRSVGSFFTNPVLTEHQYAEVCAAAGVEVPSYPYGDGRKVPAAWLIERAGFAKGYGDGRVGISSRHTLALVNRGGATTAELLTFARSIRAGVLDRFGVMLEPEPVFVGTAL